MRISDWSSDVCSSDLAAAINAASVPGLTTTASNQVVTAFTAAGGTAGDTVNLSINGVYVFAAQEADTALTGGEFATQIHLISTQTGEIGRASCGERVSVRVDLGGRRTIKTKKN